MAPRRSPASFVDTYNNRGAVAWNEWCSPERRHGFEQWTAYGTYDNHLKPMYWNTEASREDFYYVDQWGPSYEADRAIDFIRTESKQSDHPFALVVSMNPPHTGYELVPDSFKQRYTHLDVEALAAQKPYIPPQRNTRRRLLPETCPRLLRLHHRSR